MAVAEEVVPEVAVAELVDPEEPVPGVAVVEADVEAANISVLGSVSVPMVSVSPETL